METIGSRFGSIPSHLPAPHLPDGALPRLRLLISPAFTVAILGAIESLLSATVADGMIDSRHRSNTELIAQGIANVASALFGGLPATGASPGRPPTSRTAPSRRWPASSTRSPSS